MSLGSDSLPRGATHLHLNLDFPCARRQVFPLPASPPQTNSGRQWEVVSPRAVPACRQEREGAGSGRCAPGVPLVGACCVGGVGVGGGWEAAAQRGGWWVPFTGNINETKRAAQGKTVPLPRRSHLSGCEKTLCAPPGRRPLPSSRAVSRAGVGRFQYSPLLPPTTCSLVSPVPYPRLLKRTHARILLLGVAHTCVLTLGCRVGHLSYPPAPRPASG